MNKSALIAIIAEATGTYQFQKLAMLLWSVSDASPRTFKGLHLLVDTGWII